MLQVILYLECKKDTDEGDDREYIAKDHAKLIDSAKDEVVVQDVDNPILSRRHLKKHYECSNR